jgi:hypothetical protein
MATDVKPLFVRWIKLTIVEDDGTTTHDFQCAVTQAGLTSTGGDPVALNTLCPEGSFSENTERTWQLTITAAQDVESADSLQLFLLEHEGETAEFTYYPKTDKAGTPVGRGFTGTVTLSPPDAVGNQTSGAYATFTATLPLQGKYSMVDAAGNPIPNKASVKPDDVFPAEPTITASDAPNAAKLAGLGYVVDATTVPWASGKNMTVGTFAFHWDDAAAPAAWAAGAHALAASSGRTSTKEPAAA